MTDGKLRPRVARQLAPVYIAGNGRPGFEYRQSGPESTWEPLAVQP